MVAVESGAAVSHVFNTHGAYSATVSVSDGRNTVTKSIAIQVAFAPPVIQPLSFAVSVPGVSQTTVAAQINATDRENLALTYSRVIFR